MALLVGVVLALIVVSVFAGALAPYEPDELHLVDRFQGPSARYLLGTDQLGRDLLSRLIHGARISVFVGLAGTTVHVVVAALIGGTAGFFGGNWILQCNESSMPGCRSRDCCCC